MNLGETSCWAQGLVICLDSQHLEIPRSLQVVRYLIVFRRLAGFRRDLHAAKKLDNEKILHIYQDIRNQYVDTGDTDTNDSPPIARVKFASTAEMHVLLLHAAITVRLRTKQASIPQ